MKDYIIMTDSSCDLPAQLAEELGVMSIPLMVLLDGKAYRNYLDEREIICKEFYGALREGKQGTTSAVNVDEFLTAFEEPLKQGKDLIYLGFSSGLSATYHASTIAAMELRMTYPERTLLTVDTLCASMGQGLLVYLAAMKKREGASIEELRDYVEETKMKVSHWVTVDDLNHLKRGGRISAASALLGSTLNIKPIIHVNNSGSLVSVDKVRGRKNALKKLLQEMQKLGTNLEEQTIFLSHSDALEDAKILEDMIRNTCDVKDIIVGYIGPVIGAHTGAGTVALFFLGTSR